MKKLVCVKPSKAVALMKKFIREVSPLCDGYTFTQEGRNNLPNGLLYVFDHEDYWNKLQEWAHTYGTITKRRIDPLMNKTKEVTFGVQTSDHVFNECATLFTYNWAQLNETTPDGVIIVYRDMEKRASYMRGFARVTKNLLHEIGHVATAIDVWERYGLANVQRKHMQCRGNAEYVTLPDEYAATQWAIDWLADTNNRKKAKAFEKEFFKCFVRE